MRRRNDQDFRSRNTLQSTQQPNFDSSFPHPLEPKTRPQQNPADTRRYPITDTPLGQPGGFLPQSSPYSLPSSAFSDLPPFRPPPLLSSPSVGLNQQSPQNLGDSSSLFDFNSPASIDFAPRTNAGAIPFQVGFPTNIPHMQGNQATYSEKMVNERAPAKAQFYSTSQGELPSSPSDNAYPPKHLQPSMAPTFGQTSMPQSPLRRKEPEAKIPNIFIPPKPARPEHHREQPRPYHPDLQPANGSVKNSVHGGDSRKVDIGYGAPVPISRPSIPAYKSTAPVASQTFSSLGSSNQGFRSGRPSNVIDLTRPEYRDPMSAPEPHTFVNPTKAAADLKALLEGSIEDEDDKPRTRSRKKRQDDDADSLVAKLQGLDVSGNADDEEAEEEDDGSVEGIKVKLLPHQVEGLEWMRERELGARKKGAVPKGGILADDMGLGKTLQSISLILTNPKPTGTDLEESKRKFPSNMEKCTLVVAPLALIKQWEAEIKDKVESSHKLQVYVHHGPQRTKRFQDLKKYDVVVTTYQILVSELGSSSNADDGLKVGCFGLHWYRVILDEAHTIKNRNAKATQACYALRSEYRWCLTGTPMQNNLDELQSLIKFLRIKPYDDLKEWKDQIDRPMKNGRGDVAIKRLQHYLKIFMKRRTKEILKKDGALNPGGKPSAAGEASTTGFKVTERRIEKVFAEFSPEERLFYERLEQRADKSLEEMMGGEKINYASALVLLLRLRQACNHPNLVAGKLGKDGEALGIEGANASRSPSKAKVSASEIDEMADLFGGLGVGTKKCDVCQQELSKDLTLANAIRCDDCEMDLRFTEKKHKQKKKKAPKQETAAPIRKPRNRQVVLDSDDEEEADWLVPEDQRGPTKLGKAGGIDDENAEGEGISLGSIDSEDSDSSILTLSGVEKKVKKGVIVLDSGNDDSDSNSEVEAEFQSSSEEETKFATVISSTKITHLLKILKKESSEHKFIVFSQFTSMLNLIEPFLDRDGYKFTRYDGSMKNELREQSLTHLRDDSSYRVLLCSLKCGSLGLNLTAATRVVILEPFWNPFVEEQAIDRVHRLTQKIDVIVYKITIKDSVEERILELQEKKRELANQTIEGGAKTNAGKLGMTEILQLFRRDAEHIPPNPGSTSYTLGTKGSILHRTSAPRSNSGLSSTEGSISGSSERRVTPPAKRAPRVEHPVYGRR